MVVTSWNDFEAGDPDERLQRQIQYYNRDLRSGAVPFLNANGPHQAVRPGLGERLQGCKSLDRYRQADHKINHSPDELAGSPRRKSSLHQGRAEGPCGP